jgi:hypothetical protein
MRERALKVDMDATEEIDKLLAGLTDWRGATLAKIRQVIHEADPQIVEEWKWMGSPCWSHDGLIAVGNAFKTSVKLGFLYGASLPDPGAIFNDELKGNQRRAIKYLEGDSVEVEPLKALIRAGIEYNQAKKSTKKSPGPAKKATGAKKAAATKE